MEHGQAAAWSFIVTLTSAAVLWSSDAAAFRMPNCEQRDVRSEWIAPDGAWMATLYYNVCSDGLFVAVVDHTVEIARPDEPVTPMPEGGTVFAMDERPFGVEKALAIRWTSPRELEITLPNDVRIGRQQFSFEDVAISYRLAPGQQRR